jgi:hypothetical protein
MKVVWAILIGGLIAGAGDIAYAIIHYNLVYDTPPERILQSVAAGLLGPEEAQGGGWNTALIGLAAHFLIALGMAAVFVGASLVLPLLRKLWWIAGPLYGVALLFAMNMVIVPLSRANSTGQLPEGQFLYGAIAAHVLVGLVIAAAARFVLGDGGKARGDATPDFLKPRQ